MKVHLIAAARPNFMKVAPVWHKLSQTNWCIPTLVHTGQHYDSNMSETFLKELGLPTPEYNLGVGSGTHAKQTAGVLVAYEEILIKDSPDWVIVVGDVNSTLACTLAAKKLCLPVAHLEAGLRSGDRNMPEEINRVITDAISDVLWTPSHDADQNLRREGVSDDRINMIGNIMIDCFELMRNQIENSNVQQTRGLFKRDYGVITLHRPGNVDEPSLISNIIDCLMTVATDLPLIFPVHPRTRKKLYKFNLMEKITANSGIILTEPMSYVQFMNLVINSKIVITDSGGIQEETTYLGIPCVTLRNNTERPITIQQGTNRLATFNNLKDQITKALFEVSDGTKPPPLWDGNTAARLAIDLEKRSLENKN